MRNFLIVSFILFLLGSASAQPVNTNIVGGVVFDGEPYLAINPTNADNIVIAWMSQVLTDKQIAIRTRRTTDGGLSWTDANILPHSQDQSHSADVSMAFTKNGLLFISYVDYKESPDSGGIYVAGSTNGGASWGTPVEAFNFEDVPVKRPIDRPWMVVDQSSTASEGTLYITTKPAPWILPPNRPYFKRSTDGGKTWTPIAALDGDPYPVGNVIAAPMASPAVSSSGMFSTVYPSYQVGKPARYIFQRSYDKGNTFERYILAETITHPLAGDTLSKLGQHLVCDPNDSNHLALVAPSDKLGDWDVVVSSSSDGGKTWGAYVRVNDDQISNGIWQDLVWCNYDQKGRLVVAWRDRRNGTQGYSSAADIYFAVSTDNGQHFGKNIRLSDVSAPFNQILNFSGNDFLCMGVVNDSICCAWGDTRNTRLGIYFAKAALADGIAAVRQVDASRLFEVYPSVVTSEFRFTYNGSEKIQSITLLGLDGKNHPISTQIVSPQTQLCKLPSNLASGVYFVNLITQEKTYIQKIWVVR